MDSDVARTLAELERKLQELELALSSAPTRSEQPRQPSAPQPAGARLVDEGLEDGPRSQTTEPPRPEPPTATAPPSPAAEPPNLAPAPPSHAAAPPGHAAAPPGLAAAPPSPAQTSDASIELAELARFRDRLEQMTRELVEDYERVIRLRRPGQTHQPVDGA